MAKGKKSKRKKQKQEIRVEGREKFYRGKNLEELKSLDIREVAKLMPARSRRTVLRNSDVIQKFINSCKKKNSRGKKIRTHKRDLIIVPGLVGMVIAVHNGRNFEQVPISIEMIGHRLGEFSQTRGKVNHSGAGVGATKGSRAKKK
ncbi:30S ribosomal protein S19 [Candidatus Pacearchaeota archaeon CG10_big_fil_rev_8_21_14_0_10_35_219]|nr:30S ribosomal protein S19 [Candidatus Pacearchaeota archaeon]OIO42317.1 MAG: hypothetical protein AUJ63_03515 [Candidatus Pacearchaeota archaeon CG1_02_35_32]PIO07448.1 MAG: 30S ribosomal protein S19 [Candidatus Pacearchaeota archaeon CG10_big_fil_rev_8_21_14_0_10_35_219]PIY81254.1 MAG: 30S ribosomal protein S19 [Candidatus Pacearchaeota archaeon CG_4_10_14_0_8_um_filter_35_169]PIZ80183.1 MAG: 30S ribosomal protein S19 [Candidatus Pacearchaeota archaeon CG_4_10_14_0_2_um_filter_35_33]PJA695